LLRRDFFVSATEKYHPTIEMKGESLCKKNA